jgi:hypothetical protein
MESLSLSYWREHERCDQLVENFLYRKMAFLDRNMQGYGKLVDDERRGSPFSG